MLLPPSIREASGHFLNWIYNDVFHADDGVQRVALGDFVALPGFGTYVRVFYEWTETDGGSRLTLGVNGDKQRMASRWANTTLDRPPFSLLMRVWFEVCHKMGVLSEGELFDMDGPIARARVAEWPVYHDCW
jgi:hypothetical protein